MSPEIIAKLSSTDREMSGVAPVRVCVFAAPTDRAWLADVEKALPVNATLTLLDTGSTGNSDVRTALSKAVGLHPGDDLILLRAGTALPPYWCERLLRALTTPDVLVAAPLDNLDPTRAPLPESALSDAGVAAIDALCYSRSRHLALDWPTFSPLLSAWRGTRLQAIDLARIGDGHLASELAPLRCVLLDHLYVADPARDLVGPPAQAPGSDPVPPSPLGELREQLGAVLASNITDRAFSRAFYPGLDPKPVVLHVLHGWGGGAERFVRDLANADNERHHLVLIARGNFPRRCYGEVLELHDASLSNPPLRRIVLPNPIRSTALTHPMYAAFLVEILRDFGIDSVMISSLIGHSLDALRTGLPTIVVGHDFYPLWPLLHRDFGDATLKYDSGQLHGDLASVRHDFEFAERDPGFWSRLRDAYVTAMLASKAKFVAPSRTMLANLLRIEPRFSTLPQSIIAHGLAAWPPGTAVPLPAPSPRVRLRLIVPGRVRAGKGAELLRAALPGLREHAEIFLLGAGAEGEQFFGERDVHVVLNYRRDELPALLARVAPDAALLLPTVAETFSYTLSELNSLGVPAIATRVGALAERVDDGVDGWLVAPQAQAVIAATAKLQQDPASIEQARAALARHPQRGIAEMAADYRTLLPVATHPIARYPLRQATPDRVAALIRAGEIGAGQRSIASLQALSQTQQNELHRRGEWGMSLEREVQRARRTIDQRDQQLEEQQATIAARTEWAAASADREAAARDELRRFGEVHAQLQHEFDERTRWAKSLDVHLETLRSSSSWRLTGPLRFAMRKLRAARVRVAFALRRTRSMFMRTRGSLASRGTVGTIKRIGDEFKRTTPIAPVIMVAEPDSDFLPFALPTSAQPRVSVIIPVYNKIDYSIACLRSIAAHPETAAFEVIVVDDDSSDATQEHLSQVGGLHVLRNAQNLGFVGSCNAGAAVAKGEFLYFLNNDTVVTAGWMNALLRCFDEEPDAGLAGAKLVYPDGRLQEAGGIVFRDGSGWNYGRFDDPADPRYNFRREADYCSGAAILIRRELFERLGAFDNRYAPAYYEDTDLAFAVRAAGLKVFYEPRACVVHFEGVTAGTDLGGGMKRHQVVNRGKFAEKWKNELRTQPAPIDRAALAPAAANHRDRGRVLIVDAYTPTPDQDSGSLRMIGLVRLLRELGYAVSFLPDNRAHAGRYTEELQALGVQALYHPFVPDPVAWLREHGRTLDVIVLARHYIAVNYVGPARLYAPQARLIFDTIDLHYLREERAAALENKPELARHAAATKLQELKLMRETDLTLVVSAAEKSLLEREVPAARIEVLSNVHAIYGCRRAFGDRHDLVFVGGFQHPPNIDAVQWFVREVFALARANLPALRLHVIGSKMPPAILELASDNVIVHGYVEDIAPFMDGSRLSVAPLRYGAGVKGKINMAMSYGLPVVATPIAVEGMHVRAGIDVMVAESAADFANAIQHAYNDAALWKMLSENGLDNVRRHFSFDAAREALRGILPAPRAQA